jgi:FkbM family methyltransferase
MPALASPVTILERAGAWWRRRTRAAKLGCSFRLSRSFEVPKTIDLGGRSIKLHLPAEHGVKAAFIDLLLDDCYGLDAAEGGAERIIDIGANVGLFGIAARRRFPQARIDCYEPNRALEPFLQSHAREAGFEYYMEAVGLTHGKVDLELGADSVLTRSHASDSGSVVQISLSEAIARMGGRVDLVKMDCEGAEWEMFEDPAAWAAVSRVAMEYHLFAEHTHHEACDAVRKLGFSIERHVPMLGCGIILAKRG